MPSHGTSPVNSAGNSSNAGDRILRELELGRSRFMEDFQPENSRRERRKRRLEGTTSTFNPVHSSKAVYDEKGVHIESGRDLCDCLSVVCPGCHFNCPKCKSPKCGGGCRAGRTWCYVQAATESIDSTEYSSIKKNFFNKD
ncbi:ARL14 effector protein-like [Panonychus citri]|uniref:ARL14 effector protein-like n=1 Tax=Panonychus citri TaxID=50023 RepID=UPI002307AEBB|nr:ARL14 effector protein-like [Panonychus citri]